MSKKKPVQRTVHYTQKLNDDAARSKTTTIMLPSQLVKEQRAQSHYIIDTITKTALSIAGQEGAGAKVEIMERLWAMQKEAENRQAEREFGIAKVAVAMELPDIPKSKMISFVDKNNKVRETPYADRADIEKVLDPICRRHGFSKEYSTDTVDGKACQVLTVRHAAGHKEVFKSPYMPVDTSGSKNNNQAAGSTAEYGRRYAIVGAFNIIGVDKDDDGNLGKNPDEKPADKFKQRVEDEAAATQPQKVSLDDAAKMLEDKLRNAPMNKRGEILMKYVKILGELEQDGQQERAGVIRAMAEENANG